MYWQLSKTSSTHHNTTQHNMQVHIVTKVGDSDDFVLERQELQKPTIFFDLSDATTEMYRRAYRYVFLVEADLSKTNEELIDKISESPSIRQVSYGRHIIKLKPNDDNQRYTIFRVLDISVH